MKIKDLESFKNLMQYLDVESFIEKQSKLSDSQAKEMIDWMIFEEERLENKLIQSFQDAKKKNLEIFDNEFAPKYKVKEEKQKALNILANINFEPRRKYSQIGIFRFFSRTIPVECKNWMYKQEDSLGHRVFIVSDINSNPFRESMDESSFRAYYAGGQSTFTILEIPLVFNLLDPNAERRLKDYHYKLSTKVTEQISSQIQAELLEGIRNLESIPELRNRILQVWSNPISVNVPPKIQNNVIVRQGYSYTLSPEQWANTVARTEVSRAFNFGRLDAYKQTGLVQRVQHAVTPDERLCAICAPLEGRVYTLSEAFTGLIPVHPLCRCTYIPLIEEYEGDLPVQEEMTENIRDAYQEVDVTPIELT